MARKRMLAPHLKGAPPKAKYRHMKFMMEFKAQLREDGLRQMELMRKETLEVCQQIADRLTPADYAAWWASTPDGNAEFLAAAKRKLADLKLADVMDDPGASAIEQSDAIDRWMKECWATLPEIEL